MTSRNRMQLQSIADSNPMRIIIAAAESPLRKTLRRQLEREPRLQVVGEAPDSRLAYALTRRLKPDILLIEAALNREYATHSISHSGTSASTIGIVVLLASADIQHIVEAFELGARGIVLKASLPHAWRTGMQSVLAGQYWVGDESVEILVQTARKVLLRPETKRLPQFGLTTREWEITAKVATGLTNKEIGQAFSIRERTVKHHLTNIFKKAGVATRLELAILVRDKIPVRAIDRQESNLSVALY